MEPLCLLESKVQEKPNYYQLLDQIWDEYGKPRLRSAQKVLLDRNELRELGFDNFETALPLGEEAFSYWRDFAEYMLLKKEFTNGDPSEYVAVKCSKRGNDVYQSRIKTRLGWLNRETPNIDFFKVKDFQIDKKVYTKLLWITLTYDTKRGSLIQAWTDLGKEYNRFVSAMRRKYGRINCLRVWESYESGYPHVHVVMMFETSQFTVFPSWSTEKGIGKLTFRIEEKEDIASLWHSFVDIQAVSSTAALFTYLKKHQEKVILGLSGSIQEKEDSEGFNLKDIKGLRTLFLCWIFRKQSFSLSGEFRKSLSDLISHLHNSNMENQVDLFGKVVPDVVWSCLGIFSGSELGIPSGIWTKGLTADEVDAVLKKRRGTS